MPTQTKFFLYTRKSTDSEDKQVYSIEHQLTELRQLATHKGLDVIAEFTENRSAKEIGRPIFNDMLARIKNGEASGILSWNPDRLARNAVDGGQLIYHLDQGTITCLQFADRMYEPTSADKLMLAVLFGMSKYHIDSFSDGITRNRRQRVQSGHWPGRPPIGYLFDRNSRTIIIDPKFGPLVRKTFELYASSQYTLKRLQIVMGAAGLRGRTNQILWRNHYYKILTHPFYVGMLRFHGELFEGKHQPLISARLFDKCQLVMAHRGKSRTQVLKPFLYRGMFTCGECSRTITMEIKKGHTYLRCTKSKGSCSQRYLLIENTTRQIAAAINKLALPAAKIDAMHNEAQMLQKNEIATWDVEVKRLTAKVAGFDAKLQRLIGLYVDGSLPTEEFRKAKESLLKLKRTEVENLTFAESHRKRPLEPLLRFIRGLNEPQKLIEHSDPVHQRDFFQKVASNLFIKDGRVTHIPRGPWKTVVVLGRFARRSSAALLPDAASASPVNQMFPGVPPRLRPSNDLAALYAFFKENPTWF